MDKYFTKLSVRGDGSFLNLSLLIPRCVLYTSAKYPIVKSVSCFAHVVCLVYSTIISSYIFFLVMSLLSLYIFCMSFGNSLNGVTKSIKSLKLSLPFKIGSVSMCSLSGSSMKSTTLNAASVKI